MITNGVKTLAEPGDSLGLKAAGTTVVLLLLLLVAVLVVVVVVVVVVVIAFPAFVDTGTVAPRLDLTSGTDFDVGGNLLAA